MSQQPPRPGSRAIVELEEVTIERVIGWRHVCQACKQEFQSPIRTARFCQRRSCANTRRQEARRQRRRGA